MNKRDRLKRLETHLIEQNGICVSCIRTACACDHPDQEGGIRCARDAAHLPDVLYLSPAQVEDFGADLIATRRQEAEDLEAWQRSIYAEAEAIGLDPSALEFVKANL